MSVADLSIDQLNKIIEDAVENKIQKYFDEDLNDEIDFSNGIPNPYYNSNKVNIELAPDIAFYFKSSAEVNNALRILIHFAKRINTVL